MYTTRIIPSIHQATKAIYASTPMSRAPLRHPNPIRIGMVDDTIDLRRSIADCKKTEPTRAWSSGPKDLPLLCLAFSTSPKSVHSSSRDPMFDSLSCHCAWVFMTPRLQNHLECAPYRLPPDPGMKMFTPRGSNGIEVWQHKTI